MAKPKSKFLKEGYVKYKKFLIRSISVFIAAPIVIACVWYGSVPFLILISAFAIVSINEFYWMMQKRGFKPAYFIGNFFTLFFIVFAFFALKKNWEPAHSAILTMAASVTLISGLFLRRPKHVIVDVAATLFGMIYIGWFLSYLLFIRSLTEHGAFLFFLMITIWANDSTAYLVGTLFGRHKLSPDISPKKSIEGSIAGLLVCIIAGIIFSQYIGMDILHAIMLGALVSIMAQVSDLVESLIKRDVGVKDSGHVIPGHGGLLDRIDSFILTAPLMYYYVVWFVGK
ncbi:MAG: phosphatidate cytidylyltransferase [Candidatus Margulisbacteria bacterium]|nr:phosphatidate cytidylyltransferase [Candidatus Margulisiibacteriota bacterium]MBU1021954.1 phosphatidate cytidylyltransferase [Candidatus Margulisiibacteriota bacterium]MBU1728933.1 phosphatidate cytidylyltransferase [Candidatus Margulisiibacteriota bacterium]MBU1954739.1 phosphatidate cytidylyltransferase [Candidatus Margulisiibacteriota bacterium]